MNIDNSVENSVENVKNSVNSHFCKVKNSAKHSSFCEYTMKIEIYITIIAQFDGVQEMAVLASFCSKKSNMALRTIDPPARLW